MAAVFRARRSLLSPPYSRRPVTRSLNFYTSRPSFVTMSGYDKSLPEQALTASIREDHDELREYHEKYLAAGANYEEMERWANLFRWELARHTVAEEIIWYPELERVLGDEGVKAADHDRKEHQESKVDLAKLDTLKVTDPEFARLFAKIWKDLEHHLKDEEERDLPNFEAKISSEESQRLSDQFEKTKKWMPTRMHPNLPNKPPFETVGALLAMPIDKVKDLFSRWPES